MCVKHQTRPPMPGHARPHQATPDKRRPHLRNYQSSSHMNLDVRRTRDPSTSASPSWPTWSARARDILDNSVPPTAADQLLDGITAASVNMQVMAITARAGITEQCGVCGLRQGL
eukprot:130770-Alexandrium_andersonii.AAC.1